jgi:peptide/nickel transport system substrate-binding protein
MDSLMMSNSPVVVLYYDEALRFISRDVEGMTANPINLLNLKKVRKF